MKTIDLLMDELRSMESEHQLRYESLCRLLNYWYPILGYDSANEMSYPAWGDSRARPAPYIAQLEAALVEATARLGWYEEPGSPPTTFDGQFITWEDLRSTAQELYTAEARTKLEELGILTKLQNGAE